MRTPGKTLLLLLLLAILSGCASAVLSGAGQQGYADPETRADRRITAEVNRRLVGDPQVPAMEVEVSTSGKVVTLRGRVPSAIARERAEALAAQVPGVTGVRNLLAVGP